MVLLVSEGIAIAFAQVVSVVVFMSREEILFDLALWLKTSRSFGSTLLQAKS